MVLKVLNRWRSESVAVAVTGFLAATVSPVLSRKRNGNDHRDQDNADRHDSGHRTQAAELQPNAHAEKRRAERDADSSGHRDRQRQETSDRDHDRSDQHARNEHHHGNNHTDQQEQQISGDHSFAQHNSGGGDAGGGGRIGDAADRLRERAAKLTGADGSGGDNSGSGGDDTHISVIRDDDGGITIDTGNIFYQSGPPPGPPVFPAPGIPTVATTPTPTPDGGNNNMDMVS